MASQSVRGMKSGTLLCLGAVLAILGGCTTRQTHEVRGRVAGFSDDARTVIVEHEAVPGYMPAMTMPFTAGTAQELSGLRVGDAIAFTLAVSRDSAWIYDVQPLPDDALPAHPAGDAPPRPSVGTADVPLLQAGDQVPAFRLTSQDGEPVRSADYRGKALVVTFIYTRCPLPNYCPLMSEQFAALQPRLKQRFGERARLLSISFDPKHDTPAVLRRYARRYIDSTAAVPWTFATGTEEEIGRVTSLFGVFTSDGPGGEIQHNLTTAVIGPEGRVERIWRGNDWTPQEVMDAVASALQSRRPAEP